MALLLVSSLFIAASALLSFRPVKLYKGHLQLVSSRVGKVVNFEEGRAALGIELVGAFVSHRQVENPDVSLLSSVVEFNLLPRTALSSALRALGECIKLVDEERSTSVSLPVCLLAFVILAADCSPLEIKGHIFVYRLGAGCRSIAVLATPAVVEAGLDASTTFQVRAVGNVSL